MENDFHGIGLDGPGFRLDGVILCIFSKAFGDRLDGKGGKGRPRKESHEESTGTASLHVLGGHTESIRLDDAVHEELLSSRKAFFFFYGQRRQHGWCRHAYAIVICITCHSKADDIRGSQGISTRRHFYDWQLLDLEPAARR